MSASADGGAGVWANEGSVSPHTVALLFQSEEPDVNVTLGSREGAEPQKQEKGCEQKIMPKKDLLPKKASWPASTPERLHMEASLAASMAGCPCSWMHGLDFVP